MKKKAAKQHKAEAPKQRPAEKLVEQQAESESSDPKAEKQPAPKQPKAEKQPKPVKPSSSAVVAASLLKNCGNLEDAQNILGNMLKATINSHFLSRKLTRVQKALDRLKEAKQ